jgi:hypothetical protein
MGADEAGLLTLFSSVMPLFIPSSMVCGLLGVGGGGVCVAGLAVVGELLLTDGCDSLSGEHARVKQAAAPKARMRVARIKGDLVFMVKPPLLDSVSGFSRLGVIAGIHLPGSGL